MRHLSAIFALLLMLSSCGMGPGGVPPSYPAKDHDPLLTDSARTATPLIAALNKYRLDHGKYPPANDQFTFPAGLVASPGSWLYFHKPDSNGYSLSLRLGWDSSLCYGFDGKSGQWSFEPGDGSPSKPLLLDP